jgi:ComF family protein
LLGKLLDLFFQSNCPLCSRSTDSVLCVDCDRQITACRFDNPQQSLSSQDLGVPLFSWGIYDGSLKRAIATCKYENHPEIAEIVGEKIGETWLKINGNNRIKLPVIPIPMHAEKLKARGFNQAEILARGFCQVTKLPCMPQLLCRVKSTKPQIETKNVQERQENLAQAFAVPKISRFNQSVILFDDIYTSGTTLKEAIATLTSANIKVHSAIVLARPKLHRE